MTHNSATGSWRSGLYASVVSATLTRLPQACESMVCQLESPSGGPAASERVFLVLSGASGGGSVTRVS